jgi:hypothetical protein
MRRCDEFAKTQIQRLDLMDNHVGYLDEFALGNNILMSPDRDQLRNMGSSIARHRGPRKTMA